MLYENILHLQEHRKDTEPAKVSLRTWRKITDAVTHEIAIRCGADVEESND